MHKHSKCDLPVYMFFKLIIVADNGLNVYVYTV